MTNRELYLYKIGKLYDYTTDASYKGGWDAYTEYSVGDIIQLSDGVYYKAIGLNIYKLPSKYDTAWTLLPEVYTDEITDYTQVDIADIDIVRTYATPFFTDATELNDDGTYTVELPITEHTAKFFGYMDREDMDTDAPYSTIYADYIVNGMNVIRKGQVMVLSIGDTYEIQIVYGINRSKYAQLFEKNVNDITVNGESILEDDWVVNWTKASMNASGKKYTYLDYVSGERTSDAYILTNSDGKTIVQPAIVPDEPVYSNMKEMTQHPYISHSDIIDLILADVNYGKTDLIESSIFDIIKSRLFGTGLILGGRVSNKEVSFTKTYSSITTLYDYSIEATYKGVWDSYTQYEIDDIVKFSDVYYKAIASNIYKLPSHYDTRWTLLPDIVLSDVNPTVYGKNLVLGDFLDPYNILITLENVSNSTHDTYTWYKMEYDHYIIDTNSPNIVQLYDVDNKLIMYVNLDRTWQYKIIGDDIYEYKSITIYNWAAINTFHVNALTTGISYPVTVKITFDLTVNSAMPQLRLLEYSDYSDVVPENETYIPITEVIGTSNRYASTLYFEITEDKRNWFFAIGDTTARTYSINGGGSIKFEYTMVNSIYEIPYSELNIDIPAKGYYNCLLNLPNMTCMEYLYQLAIISGCSLGYDNDGELKVYTLDSVKDNLYNGNVLDWSGRVSNLTNSKFTFNSNAKSNVVQYNNSDDTSYESKAYIEVNDNNLDAEADLFTVNFDLGDEATSGKTEFILYTQEVTESTSSGSTVKTFSNDYNEMDSICVSSMLGSAFNWGVVPTDLDKTYTIDITLEIAGNGTFIPIKYSETLEVGSELKASDGTKYIISSFVEYGDTSMIITTSPSIYYTGGYQAISCTYDMHSGNGFVSKYYDIYKKLVYRPIIKEIEINLGHYESANIDFEKPIYIKEWGKYCLLLDISAPDDDICTATLLLINKTL